MLRQAGGLLLLLVALNTAQSAPIQCFRDNGVDAWPCDEDVKFCFTGLALVAPGSGGASWNASGDSDMVAFGPAKGGCASKTSAEDMGIVCDGPGIKVTSTSAYAYECCMGDKCNTEMSANVSGIEARLSLVLPSNAYCSSDEGARCTDAFAATYQCMLTSVPNIALTDDCFGAVMPEVGCLAERCRSTVMSKHGENLDYATPGCPVEKIGDRMCDALCMSPASAMDGGDCLLVSTAIQRKFAAADRNSDGFVDMDEYASLVLELDSKPLVDFDIVNDTLSAMPLLDSYEFTLLLFQYDHMVQDQFMGETGAPKWSQNVALGAATLMVTIGDDNMDGMLSEEEAMAVFACTGEEFALMIALGGRFPSEEELMQMDRKKAKEMQESMQGPQNLQVADLGKVLYGFISALVGNKWADHEWRNGFSVEEAVRLIIKLADYNNDGFMSKAESAVLTMPMELFAALSPEGVDGEYLSFEDIVNALEDVSACEDLLIVDSLGELSVKTLYMPFNKCTILIQPGWNVPAHFPPSDGPTCSSGERMGEGSEQGAGGGRRRLLEYGGVSPGGSTRRRRLLEQMKGEKDTSSVNKASSALKRAKGVRAHAHVSKKSKSKRFTKLYTARSNKPFAKDKQTDTKHKGKRAMSAHADRNSVLAKHHQHHLVSTGLSSNLAAKAAKVKQHHQHHREKREKSAKQAKQRRRNLVAARLNDLRAQRPAARSSALLRNRRSNVESALEKSMEQSAMRVVKRGRRSRLDKAGMRAYRRAVHKLSTTPSQLWSSIKSSLLSFHQHTKDLKTHHAGSEGMGFEGKHAQRVDVRIKHATIRHHQHDGSERKLLKTKGDLDETSDLKSALDLTGPEYKKMFKAFPDMLASLLDDIRNSFQTYNTRMALMYQPVLTLEEFLNNLVPLGMPYQLVELLLTLLRDDIGDTGDKAGVESSSSKDFSFVARVLNGCTLTVFAMNYSSPVVNGSGSGDGGGSGGSNGDAPLPYCGLPWTVGQRVIKDMDTDGDGVISEHETCLSPGDFSMVAGFGKRNLLPYTPYLDPAPEYTGADPTYTHPDSEYCRRSWVFDPALQSPPNTNLPMGYQAGVSKECDLSRCEIAVNTIAVTIAASTHADRYAWGGLEELGYTAPLPFSLQKNSGTWDYNSICDIRGSGQCGLTKCVPKRTLECAIHFHNLTQDANGQIDEKLVCESHRGCVFEESAQPDWQSFLSSCKPAAHFVGGKSGLSAMTSGTTINPYDINRMVQYTMFMHHNTSITTAAADWKPVGAQYGDGLLNFTEYESFMEAMLVLYGDSTSPPDLDKIFEAYGYEPAGNGSSTGGNRRLLTTSSAQSAPATSASNQQATSGSVAGSTTLASTSHYQDTSTYSDSSGITTTPAPTGSGTSPGPSSTKVISVESVPMSEYWFVRLFGILPGTPLYSSSSIANVTVYTPREWSQHDVVNSGVTSFFKSQTNWSSYVIQFAREIDPTVQALALECAVPLSSGGSGGNVSGGVNGRSVPDHVSGFGSVNRSANGSVVCYDYPLFMDLEGMSCEFYSANEDTSCERSGELGTLAFMNKNGMDASSACCACGGGSEHDPTPTLYDSDGGFSCSGTLISARHVLTTAACAMTAKAVEIAASKGCPEKMMVARGHVHPGFTGSDYDIGILELAQPSKVTPVQLYEGGDLGYNDCNALGYLSVRAEEGEAMVSRLYPTKNEECDIETEARTGFQSVTKNMMCTSSSDRYMQQRMPGAPLLVPWTGSSTDFVQIGVGKTQHLYTRVSEMLQWILSTKGMGVHPARMLNLEITDLALPKGAKMTIYNGNSVQSGSSWTLDSACDAGESYVDEGSGAMLLVLEGPAYEQITLSAKLTTLGCAESNQAMAEKNHTNNGEYSKTDVNGADLDMAMSKDDMPGCMRGCLLDDCIDSHTWTDSDGDTCNDYEMEEWCLDGVPNVVESLRNYSDAGGKSAAEMCCVCGGGRGKCGDDVCEMSLSWPNITAMGKIGKSFTGGLGQKASQSVHGSYGVWACVRDWIEEEMTSCGVGPRQLACFRFDERSREFHHYGSNDELKLVAEEAMLDGLLKEEEMIALLPKAHHTPAPFLA